MITIRGKAKHEGVAIAIAARVNSINGINGVDMAILEQGIKALRKGLTPVNFPEVVVACDNLVMGVSLRIPGVNTIGIAAQADTDAPGLDIDVPCVIGLPGLMDSIAQGGFVIVDGNVGVVLFDPDPQTLIDYQQAQENRRARGKIFIALEHIPAQTRSGETVQVYAHIKKGGEVRRALDEGADGLLVNLRGSQADSVEFHKMLMRAAPGKPLVFAVDCPCDALIEAVRQNRVPGRVIVAYPQALFDELVVEASPDTEIEMGCLVEGMGTCPASVQFIVADMRKSFHASDEDFASMIAGCTGGRDAESELVMIGKRVEIIERLVRAGVRAIAVPPGEVGSCKDAIRDIGEGESISKFVALLKYHYETRAIVDDLVARIRAYLDGHEFVTCEDVDSFKREIADADAMFGYRITPEMLACAKRLKWIQFGSAGIDHTISPELLASNVILTKIQRHSCGFLVSEHVLALMLGLTRRLDIAIRQQPEHTWDRSVMAGVSANCMAGPSA